MRFLHLTHSKEILMKFFSMSREPINLYLERNHHPIRFRDHPIRYQVDLDTTYNCNRSDQLLKINGLSYFFQKKLNKLKIINSLSLKY